MTEDEARKAKKIRSDRTKAKVLSDQKRAATARKNSETPRPSYSPASENPFQRLEHFLGDAAGGARKLIDRSMSDTKRDAENAAAPVKKAQNAYDALSNALGK